MDAVGLTTTFFETFDAGARADLSAFTARHPCGGTWLIAADYVVADKTRPNDAFAFSIFPYSAELPEMRRWIREGLPYDIKATKRFEPAAGAVLRSPDVFHVGFVLPKTHFLMGTTGAERLATARRTSDEVLASAIELDRGEATITAMRRVRDMARRGSFRHPLYANVLLLSLLLPLVTVALLRETGPREIVWMPDRDSMTNWCDGAAWHIAQLNFAGLAETYGVDRRPTGPGICVEDAGENMWFDELVRVADHVAGSLAVWDLVQGGPAPGPREAFFADIFGEVFADARNLAVLKLRSDETGFGWSRLTFHR